MLMRNYDDLMGLDMYDDGMEGYYSADMFKEQMIAAGASAAGIVLAAWALPKLNETEMFKKYEEPTRHRVLGLMGVLGGMVMGRVLWNYNRDAAMAVVGGVSGIGLAQILDTFFDAHLLHGYPLGAYPGSGELSSGDLAMLAAYGDDQGMALSALENTSINTARGAFQGFSAPQISTEALMGFGSTMVQAETLGYNPYMA
jgi:hypothetical protein